MCFTSHIESIPYYLYFSENYKHGKFEYNQFNFYFIVNLRKHTAFNTIDFASIVIQISNTFIIISVKWHI